jgi:hypothetical protein
MLTSCLNNGLFKRLFWTCYVYAALFRSEGYVPTIERTTRASFSARSRKTHVEVSSPFTSSFCPSDERDLEIPKSGAQISPADNLLTMVDQAWCEYLASDFKYG